MTVSCRRLYAARCSYVEAVAESEDKQAGHARNAFEPLKLQDVTC